MRPKRRREPSRLASAIRPVVKHMTSRAASCHKTPRLAPMRHHRPLNPTRRVCPALPCHLVANLADEGMARLGVVGGLDAFR